MAKAVMAAPVEASTAIAKLNGQCLAGRSLQLSLDRLAPPTSAISEPGDDPELRAAAAAFVADYDKPTDLDALGVGGWDPGRAQV